MQFLDLDARQWHSVDDFYDALCRAIGAPDWHGTGPDAFVDSMIWGGVNSLEPPYTVRIAGTANLAPEIKSYIAEIIDSLKNGRRWRLDNRGEDIDVNVQIVS